MSDVNGDKLPEIKIISYEDVDKVNTGIFKFENCAFRSSKETIKDKSCCTSEKIKGYFCIKKNKFPISFINDCSTCDLFHSK